MRPGTDLDIAAALDAAAALGSASAAAVFMRDNGAPTVALKLALENLATHARHVVVLSNLAAGKLTDHLKRHATLPGRAA